MKNTALSSLLACAALLGACGGDPAATKTNQSLDASRATFDARLTGAGPAYTYVRTFASWAGIGHETAIRVANGVVVQRTYRDWKIDESTGERATVGEWSESGATLGTHAEGDALKTLPELYDECANEVLSVDQASNDITLTFDPSNILATCVYTPKGCQDDCSHGVRLASVTFGE